MSASLSLPRRLSAEHRRAQILDSAAELFIQRGFESVGMADLAETLQISRPAIYTYFASTEEMLDALLQAKLEGLPSRLHPYLRAERQDSLTAFDGLFLALLEERDLMMLLHSGGGPLFREKRRTFLATLQTRLQLDTHPRAQGGAASKQMIFLILHLLSSAAYAELTEVPFEPHALATTLDAFIKGGAQAVLGQSGDSVEADT